MQISKAIEGYVISCLAEGFSPLTLNVYRSTLCKLIEYIGDKQVQDITTDDLKRFMDFLVTEYVPTRNNAPLPTASHHRYWKAIRSFFKWAEKDLNVGRPDLPLKMPLPESKEIVPFTEEEVKLLLKSCDFAIVPEGK